MDDEAMALGLLALGGFLAFTESGAGVVRTFVPDFKPIDLGGILGPPPPPPEAKKQEGEQPAGGGEFGAIAGAVADVAVAAINVAPSFIEGQQNQKRLEKQAKKEQATLNLRNDIARRTKRAYYVLSRGDVREYFVQNNGETIVYHFGHEKPTILEPPGPKPNAEGVFTDLAASPLEPFALALAAEPIVRVLGRFIQRGGRLVGKWIDTPYDPGFHPKNPFAPSHLRLDTIAELRREEQEQQAALRAGQPQPQVNVQASAKADSNPLKDLF